jgi:hypothetical protein
VTSIGVTRDRDRRFLSHEVLKAAGASSAASSTRVGRRLSVGPDPGPEINRLLGSIDPNAADTEREWVVLDLYPVSKDAFTALDAEAIAGIVDHGFHLRLRVHPRHPTRTWLDRLRRAAEHNHAAASISLDVPRAGRDDLTRLEREGLRVVRDRNSESVRVLFPGPMSIDLRGPVNQDAEKMGVAFLALLHAAGTSPAIADLRRVPGAILNLFLTLMPFTGTLVIDIGPMVLRGWAAARVRFEVDAFS